MLHPLHSGRGGISDLSELWENVAIGLEHQSSSHFGEHLNKSQQDEADTTWLTDNVTKWANFLQVVLSTYIRMSARFFPPITDQKGTLSS